MKRSELTRWGLLGLLVGLSVVQAANAATSLVLMRNYTFAPSNSVIRPGDTVLWSNTVSMPVHDTRFGVSNTPTNLLLWASGDLAQRDTFAFTFTNEGVYPYICKRHVVDTPQGNPPTQTGMVFVTTVNLSPNVRITNPTNSQVFLNRAGVTVNVTAGDLDGTISRVQLFLGENPLGVLTNSPYNFTINALFAGTHTLTARATDNQGTVVTSAPVNVIIRPRTNTVRVASNTFTPSSLANGTVGDTVIFTNAGGPHTVTGDTPTEPFCGTGDLIVGMPCIVVLNNAGVLPYHCTYHQFLNMTGVVVVAGPPLISITSPASNSSVPEPGNFAVTADAIKLGGTVTNVEFFANGVSLGSDTSSPYEASASNLPAGTYTLTARAIDNSGYSGFATPIVVSVGGTQLQLLSPFILDNALQFDLTTVPGLIYVLEQSPVLPPTWSPVQTNVATGATLRVIEPLSPSAATQNFYRAFIQQ